MADWYVMRKVALGGLAVLVSATWGGGCASQTPSQTARTGLWTNSPEVCARDEVREVFCEELVPRQSALPAPEPYATCPATTENHRGFHEPRPPVAVFDADHTEVARKRVAPGHSCCYSWCVPLELGSADAVAPQAGCGTPSAIRESYCIAELEGGTSAPASGNLPSCPVAIRPPNSVAFSAPDAAPLDLGLTSERRAKGSKECCYGWCSVRPEG